MLLFFLTPLEKSIQISMPKQKILAVNNEDLKVQFDKRIHLILGQMNWVTTIGIVAAVLTTSAFVPQAFKIIRMRQTKDLSLTMYVMMFTGQLCWLAYGIYLKDFPLILANIIGGSLSGTILVFKLFLKE
jgi:MtN3 and saliva related transmembrane protein